MHYKEKKKLKELLQAVIEGLTGKDLTRINHKAFNHIKESISLVKEILEKEQVYPSKTLDKLTTLQEALDDRYSLEELQEHCNSLMRSFEDEVEGRYKVVFFPYKASMWDSLESIYFAARDDDLCDAEVVPIPYYKLSEDNAEITYEGALFPADIPITHYSAYDLEKERPDVIYVHNIYDQHNTLTRVFEEYYTVNLKKCTDMLVYVPYCLFSFIPGSPGEYIAYKLPGIQFVDKVVLQHHYLEKGAVEHGVPAEKILVAGSPKIDKLFRVQDQGPQIPLDWKEKIMGKTVFLLDTNLFFFSAQGLFYQFETIIKLFNIPNVIENSVLVWRPHPLMKTALEKYNPYLLNYLVDLEENRIGHGEYANVIFDDNADYLPSLVAADVYIGGISSLMLSYLATEKPIILLMSELPENSLVSSSVFRFLPKGEENWVEVIKNVTIKHDRIDRCKPIEQFLCNTDGTSGRKIHDVINSELNGR